VRRIVTLGLTGWAGIVGLSWWLADRRVALCGYDETACKVRATAARDTVLTSGLTVALALILIVAAWSVLTRRRTGPIEGTLFPKMQPIETARREAVRLAQVIRPSRGMLALVLAVAAFVLGLFFAGGFGGNRAALSGEDAPIEELGLATGASSPVDGDPYMAQGSDVAAEASDGAAASWQDAPLAEEEEVSGEP